MDKPKVFLYDTSRGFSRFIKIIYTEKMNLTVCSNPSDFDKASSEKFDIAFITINQYEDLLYFAYLVTKVELIFVGSTIDNVNKMIPKFEKAILLDLKEMKAEMLKVIDLNLDLFMLNIG